MFRLMFSKTYDNNIFTRYGVKPVVEDRFCVTYNAFCVADGVTRDDIKGNAVIYPNTKEEVQQWLANYPNPSGAYEAAKICTDKFVQYISETDENNINQDKILDIIKKVNEDIGDINKNREINYLDEDYYCCEAVGGIIMQDVLYCFSIGDCHITLIDENMDIKFTTINNHKQFEEYLNNVYCKENKYDWNNPIDRIMVRKEFRNKPKKKYNNKDISYGALSGEKNAEYYIDVYKISLDGIKYICAYSDGCEPIFESKQEIRKIILNPSELKNIGKERTLVIYENYI